MAYPGGKNGAGVYQTIINLMPPHVTYIEPFLGHGAIMRLKRPATFNYGIDKDPYVKRLWDNEIDAEILTGDGIEFLRNYKFNGTELVYCDPPYMHETRSSRSLYNYEMADERHLELLDVIKSIPSQVIISGYYSELYARELRSWNTKVYQAMTRGGKMAEEWLWYNYDTPDQLHDYSYVGENFRERERIKKKKDRWVANLENMEPIERNTIIDAILNTWHQSNYIQPVDETIEKTEPKTTHQKIPPNLVIRVVDGEAILEY